ncbi:hypothetical protein HHL22_02065 [Hymenobacter sp. RP-2-7]|uniref:Uncharacterized protein n=1 Tax=Hymenobacter polaris TaxID=2682546 RepID=A0A7Y0ABD3_9BACT|nr:hypothetical protein [Hymenobacter polaris]NML63980.1 hypothetical protein [Hymenobacter polaris]
MFYLPTNEAIETIDREHLAALHFNHDDVLEGHPAEQRRRRADAERAVLLTHGDNKTTIYFRTADGHTKRVRAKVLTAHSQYLTLKGDIQLPIRAVLGIDS